jgi:hypothetical protein
LVLVAVPPFPPVSLALPPAPPESSSLLLEQPKVAETAATVSNVGSENTRNEIIGTLRIEVSV